LTLSSPLGSIFFSATGPVRLPLEGESPVHALIIEDEFFVADLIEDALRRIGYTSFSLADGGPEAIRAAGERCPDLIVADHRLADGAGIDAILGICAGKEMPVIFISASAWEVRKRFPDAVVLQKPFLAVGLQTAAAEAVRAPYVHH
jgi:DNA-binding response OmpR family regulator